MAAYEEKTFQYGRPAEIHLEPATKIQKKNMNAMREYSNAGNIIKITLRHTSNNETNVMANINNKERVIANMPEDIAKILREDPKKESLTYTAEKLKVYPDGNNNYSAILTVTFSHSQLAGWQQPNNR